MNATTLAIIATMPTPKRDHNLPPGTTAPDLESDDCPDCDGEGCEKCAGLGTQETTKPKSRGPLSGYAGIRKFWPK